MGKPGAGQTMPDTIKFGNSQVPDFLVSVYLF